MSSTVLMESQRAACGRTGRPRSTESVWAGLTRSSSSPKSDLVTLFDDNTSNFTRIQSASRWSTGGTYFEGNNFYIYIRGTEDAKGDWWREGSSYRKLHREGGVLVNCHFDSVSTGFGATDDGIGCVTILQLLSYFTSSGRQPKNGIVLLFNNAEEDGLLGANAFGQSAVWEFIHTFVNLEGAGAGGRAILFRATDLEIAKAYSHSPHPFGSIVAADAFKQGLIRSGTDYEIFESIYGERGMDIAFYGPRARYHTDQDDARHASVDSVWHMLSAALASTEQLSKTSNTVFSGDRRDGDEKKVQNGKPTKGVWFDIFGSAWATLALRGLFAWSLTLLAATPLILLVVTFLLSRKDKYYFFARDVKIHSELNDDPVRIGGWKGLFRFPLAFIFAGALTIASTLLIAKFNPLIIYSSAYAVWAMTVSLFYFSFWLIMRGSSFVRPSALHRGFTLIWLFILGWAMQVLAAVAEDRWKIGALYSTAFLQSAVFVSLLISMLEMFALPGKKNFARSLHDAHQAQDAHGNGDSSNSRTQQREATDDEGSAGPSTPTETTPLRTGEQGYGSDNQQTTFASTYRQSVSAPASSDNQIAHAPPYEREQSWSGRLPQWTWFLQFLLLAPIPVILMGNLGLTAMTSLRMTGSDGSSLLTPLLTFGVITILLLLPVAPFIHRVTHHVPLFLLLVFIGTFIYNMIAFPFSIESRFKFFFQQVVDLDAGTDVVQLYGLEEFLRPIIDSVPSAAGQHIICNDESIKRGLQKCQYDATSLAPELVAGKQLDELIAVTVPKSKDSSKVHMTVDALNTRTCVLELSKPIYGFTVDGASKRDERLGSVPEHGFKNIDLWRRTWDGPWNITLDVEKNTKSIDAYSTARPANYGSGSVENNEPAGKLEAVAQVDSLDELKKRTDDLEVTVTCRWSDANKRSTIPALHELQQFMPSWAAVTKAGVGLVDVKKTYKLR